MTIIYKVVKKTSKGEYLSSSATKIVWDYRKPYKSKVGLFVFKHLLDAYCFADFLKDSMILRGATNHCEEIFHALDTEFTYKDHNNFWSLYNKLQCPPSEVEMMKANLYPRTLPVGSYVIFDWRYLDLVMR